MKEAIHREFRVAHNQSLFLPHETKANYFNYAENAVLAQCIPGRGLFWGSKSKMNGGE